MSSITYISKKDFQNAKLNHSGFSILECVGENSAILKTMEAVLQKVQNSIPVHFNHLRINLRENPFIIEQFYVLQEPSYLVFFNGNFIDRMDGIMSFQDFSSRVNQHIKHLKMDIN